MNEDAEHVNEDTRENAENLPKSPFGEAGPALYAAGFPVLPLKAGEKRPAIDEWSRYCTALPAEADILRWSRRELMHGIGLACGKFVRGIDIDIDDPVLIAQIVAFVGAFIGAPAPAKRGAKGLTLLVSGSETARKSVIAVWRRGPDGSKGERLGQIEFLGLGQQTVLPPSIHPGAGRPYMWLTPASGAALAGSTQPMPEVAEDGLAALLAGPAALPAMPDNLPAELVKTLGRAYVLEFTGHAAGEAGDHGGARGGDHGQRSEGPKREGHAEWNAEVAANVEAMLTYLDPSHDYDSWRDVLAALDLRFGSAVHDLLYAWSARSTRLRASTGRRGYDPEFVTSTLRSLNKVGRAGPRVGIGTIFTRARAAGWNGQLRDGYAEQREADAEATEGQQREADDALMRELLDLLTWDDAPETTIFEGAFIEALARIRGRDEAAYQRWRGELEKAGVRYATLRALDRATDERVKTARKAAEAAADAARAERMRSAAEQRNRGKEEPFEFTDADAAIDWFNSRCAIVNASGHSVIAYNWRPSVEFASERNAEMRFRDKRVFVADDDGDADMLPAFRLWTQSPQRRLFDGVAFVPGRYGGNDPGDESTFNLWRGWGVPPADCSADEAAEGCKLIRAHMFTIVCNGNEEHYRYLVRWLAHLVQRPWEKPGVAVVLRGKKGAGKDTLGTYISRIVGEAHYMHQGGSERLTDRFNGDFKQALFLHAEEGTWGGDPKANNTMKSLITATTMTVEEKYMPRVKIRNSTRFFLSSNEHWVVDASDDERRYLVLDVNPARLGDREYFVPLYAELDGDGPAMLHRWLLEQDISDFDVRSVPRTDALRAQAVEGYRNVRAFVHDILNGGHECGHWTVADPLEISVQDLHAAYLRAAAKQRYRFDGQIGPQQFTRRLREVLPVAFGKDRETRASVPEEGGKRPLLFRLDLTECRAEFEQGAGPQDWLSTGD